mmetsp:Transcript_23967/g.35178  ORF Transcript_23967/g.35178 Transcript_23967/m.35178 type:complete len:820 (+) Transcript_23967:246-2705(+)|eukprot:CAMPEP_0185022682 /NCGR_PEP_ID=MMETSP1103-20130426/5383_1 /TAXON_ID=36769 /ORGANISM="Paraphysomonas bandaiensis, Strain Caron Lab Isolate" /LENGTH=819 /DNA_ID=CAMNT_0027554863 /DNA_START=167 /DNA_END=2626 /DNA_ORIENTATION=-
MSSDITFRDITEMVREKERELHEAHEMRCLQLESIIEDREKLLSEATRKFGLLKDDFQYNLTLLEARDSEISRLTQSEIALKNELDSKEAECTALSKRLESMQAKEIDRIEQSNEYKARTKQMLHELQEEIEAIRWSTADDIGSKTREVEHLKSEVRRLQRERDDALEEQRVELTNTYEDILQSREQSFLGKESEIAEQVSTLEKRFTALTTENTRLKSELANANRSCEKAVATIAAKEERCVQLEWALTDADRERRESEDDLHRRLQKMQSELSSSESSVEQITADYRRDIEKVKSELKRDKEYAALKIRHWEDLHRRSEEETLRLEGEVSELEGREAALRRDLATAESTVTRLTARETELIGQLKDVVSREEQFRGRAETLQIELNSAQTEISRLQEQLNNAEQAVSEARANTAEQLKVTAAHNQELAKHQEDMRAAEVEMMRAQIEAEFITRQDQFESKLHADLDTARARLQESEEAREQLQQELDKQRKIADDERAEGDALRLRLRLQGENPGQGTFGHSGAHQVMHGVAAASPMFSEDMGPVSVPVSPGSPLTQHGRVMSNNRQFSSWSPQPQNSHGMQTSDDLPYKFPDGSYMRKPQRHDDGHASADSAFEMESFERENKRLKAAIREMRRDAESLQFETERALAEKAVADTRVSELEGRLQHAAAEVNRLRQERRRLMDVSNELRAALHKCKMEMAASSKESNVDTGSGRPHSSAEERTQNDDNTTQGEDRVENDSNYTSTAVPLGGYGLYTRPLKGRATDRETPSQQAALQKLKEKSTRPSTTCSIPKHGRSAGPPRKVVNYSSENNFESL